MQMHQLWVHLCLSSLHLCISCACAVHAHSALLSAYSRLGLLLQVRYIPYAVRYGVCVRGTRESVTGSLLYKLYQSLIYTRYQSHAGNYQPSYPTDSKKSGSVSDG